MITEAEARGQSMEEDVLEGRMFLAVSDMRILHFEEITVKCGLWSEEGAMKRLLQ